MSEHPKHGATTIRASKGGGGGKWLLGAVAAVVIAGGAYAAYTTMAPSEPDRYAINNAYEDDFDPLHAGPVVDGDALADDAADDGLTVAPASADTPPPAPVRRETASAEPTPAPVYEETIGVTPASTSVEDVQDDGEIIIQGARRPIWARTPSERRLSSLYPTRALERGREGEARLSCTVLSGGALDCVRTEETPGFGGAALRVAQTLRHAPTFADGTDATGTPVNLRVVFRLEDEERQRYAAR
ncbi:MAG: energy transducer TonB [Hyphomonadaceae bacterium]|nr:energy transducer TonB [Hyphomonadaceae bacterium]